MDFCKSTCSWVEIGHYWDMGNRLCYNQRSSHKNVPTRSEYLNQRKLTIHCCDVIFLKNEISDLKWTETTNNLVASSIDGWIKVFIAQCYPLYLYLIYWPANEWRKQLMCFFFPFVADLVNGQWQTRPQFTGRFTLYVFDLVSKTNLHSLLRNVRLVKW